MSLVNSTTIRLFYSIDHQGWYKIEALARGYELIGTLPSVLFYNLDTCDLSK